MNTDQNERTETQYRGECGHPVGERLSDYLANLLKGAAAKEVEDHLLECRHCGDFFLAILSIRSEARRSKNVRGEDRPASDGAEVLRLADFRKTWP